MEFVRAGGGGGWVGVADPFELGAFSRDPVLVMAVAQERCWSDLLEFRGRLLNATNRDFSAICLNLEGLGW